MESIKELADEIYRERVLRARKQTMEQRFRAGFELFEGVCERMSAGIRHQHPQADEETVQEILRQRLALLRRLRSST
jgi:hypothetical protein